MGAEKQPGAVILSGGETPSTDYFLVPHLEKSGFEVSFLDWRTAPLENAFDMDSCRMVVISRYISKSWFKVLDRLHQQGTRLVYFMDDDLFDLAALLRLPRQYRWKLVTQAWAHRSRLLRMCDEFWVSTPYLADKYAKFNPVRLDPAPSQKTLESRKCLKVCYHGTASHHREIEWLMPIIAAVQAQNENVHFELFGTHEVNHRFRKLPRVSVLHPMNWSNYLAFTATQRRDIALAPLLKGGFNAARGPTKFYDYARMGAVGLYTDAPPYRGFIRDGVDGLLLDNDTSVWVEAIMVLAQDEQRRVSMSEEVRRRCATPNN